MSVSRRQVVALWPAAIAAAASGTRLAARAQGAPGTAGVSQTFRNEDLRASRNGDLVSRQMLRGRTRSGYLLDLHESELPAGTAPHAPHQHVHEEMLLIREGLLDVTIGAQTTRLGPGSSAYMASNQLHGWRNVGTVTARYFVLALGDDTP